MSQLDDTIVCARLFGPLASWGTPEAGSTTRPSARHPSRGAIIGLVAASLGVRREDEAAQHALGRSLLVAVASHGPRRLAAELRTVQTIEPATGETFATRREAIEVVSRRRRKLHTTPTTRQHIEDGLWRIFVAVRPGSTITAQGIADAVARPAFEFYLGRREFPLALPPAPELVPGGLERALGAYAPVPMAGSGSLGEMGVVLREIQRRIIRDGEFDLAWDKGFPGAPEAHRSRDVLDDPFSRGAWRFRSRLEMSARRKAADLPPGQNLADEFFPGGDA